MEPNRIKLTIRQIIGHYFFLLPILLLPIAFLSKELVTYKSITYFPWFEIALILIAIYFVYNRYKALEFKTIQIQSSQEEFKSSVKATAIELGWNIAELSNEKAKAIKSGLGWQWNGLMITIIHNDRCIQINSIIVPAVNSNPFSFGWNKRNIKVFTEYLSLAIKGKNVTDIAKQRLNQEEIYFENESEWTFKNTLKRMGMYLLILILLSISLGLIFYSIFNEGLLEALLVGLPILGFCLWYLITDIRIILLKRRKA